MQEEPFASPALDHRRQPSRENLPSAQGILSTGTQPHMADSNHGKMEYCGVHMGGEGSQCCMWTNSSNTHTSSVIFAKKTLTGRCNVPVWIPLEGLGPGPPLAGWFLALVIRAGGKGLSVRDVSVDSGLVGLHWKASPWQAVTSRNWLPWVGRLFRVSKASDTPECKNMVITEGTTGQQLGLNWFSSVTQLCPTLCNPGKHTRLLCPSPTPGAYSNLRPLHQQCHPSISSSVFPFSSCSQSFPAFFSNESVLHIRRPKYWSFSFSISPSNEHPGLVSFRMDWLDLLAVQGTLKSPTPQSKASVLWCSAFFIVPLSYPYMTIGKTMALTRQTFVGKVMSLLFNMLSRLVIAFLPRSKLLLISWLQSTICSDFGAQKNSLSLFPFPIYLPWSDGTGCHDLSFLNVEF